MQLKFGKGNNNTAIKSRSLKSSLSGALILSSGIILLLIFAVFISYDRINYRHELANQLDAIAQVTANSSQGALSFVDEDAADLILQSLKYYPNIRYAVILDAKGQPFSEYRNNWPQAVAARIDGEHIQMTERLIHIHRTIIWDNEDIGHLYLLSDLSLLNERQIKFAMLGLIIFSLAMLFASLLARRIIRPVLEPILELVSLTRKIILHKNYSLRAKKCAIDEINTLVDGTNDMLEQIASNHVSIKNSAQRLSLALQGAGEGLWDMDIVTGQLYLDKYSCLLLAMPGDEALMSKHQWRAQIHPLDIDRVRDIYNQFLNHKDTDYAIEYRGLKNNDWIWLKFTGKVTQWQTDGRAARVTGTLQDITQRRDAEEQVKLYACVFNNTSNAVVILDMDFKVLAVNQAYTQITQFDEDDAHNEVLCSISDVQNSDDIVRELRSSGHWSGELSDRKKDGTPFDMELTLNSVLRSGQADYSHIVAVFTDITERKKSADDMFFMANFDPLTQLANRAMFHNHFKKALSNASRYGTQLALLFIDLDKFKQVNDTLGHDAGDEVLMQSAKRLAKPIRGTDMVARLAGDEFVVLLENIESLRHAEVIARRIQQDFQREFIVNGQSAAIGTSIGISTFPNDGLDADTLLRNADIAMYHAKSHGRNSFHFYDKAMNNEVERRNLLEQELRKALKRQQIIVYYQPKVDTFTFEVRGFEALVRWQHPDLGLISPDEFIPIAEDAGIIREIGLFVFTTACEQLYVWHQQGFDQLHMAINVSAREFQLSDYPIVIAHLLAEMEVDPKFIELELTESIVMENPQKTLMMLNVIKKLNLSLAIDDFGTGYSSLSYLTRFPLDILKVDKAFVHELSTNKNAAAVAAAIISMAHDLHLKVVAEGVETEQQLEFFMVRECELIQGFYFSPPLPSNEAEKVLQPEWRKQFEKMARAPRFNRH